MSKKSVKNNELFARVKMISNRQRFRIIELTENEQFTITELSQKLKLAYNKCADYVRMLEEKGLVEKTKVGKEVKVRSMVNLNADRIEFLRI